MQVKQPSPRDPAKGAKPTEQSQRNQAKTRRKDVRRQREWDRERSEGWNHCETKQAQAWPTSFPVGRRLDELCWQKLWQATAWGRSWAIQKETKQKSEHKSYAFLLGRRNRANLCGWTYGKKWEEYTQKLTHTPCFCQVGVQKSSLTSCLIQKRLHDRKSWGMGILFATTIYDSENSATCCL